MKRIQPSAARAAVLGAVLAGLVGCGGDEATPSEPGTSTSTPPVEPTPQEACDALAGKTIGGAAISAATLVAAAGQTGEHCKVAGVIGTSLRFEATLPTAWNRKLLYAGGGGWDGVIAGTALSPSGASGGYVTIASNGGHDDPSGAVFLDNPQAQRDFGYLSIHTVLEAVKLIVQQRYGAEAERYYFEGCSNGGREALIQASRYPEDFDGIVVRAPAYSFTQLLLAFNNNMKHMLGTPGGAITPAKASAIAGAVLSECDALDGIADGVISDAASCAFDPAELLCAAGDNDGCLTDEQLNTAKTIYSEFKLDNGTSMYPGWGPGGEDQGWPPWLIGNDTTPPLQQFFSDAFIRYWLVKDASFDSLTFDPEAYLPQIEEAAGILDASPDLNAFFAREGKMILVHGTYDWAISYKGSIKYFNDVATAVGGAATRDESMEFFLQPGVQHCFDGAGPDTIDLLDAITKWVEDGQRPSSANLVSTKLDTSGDVVLDRPLCQYPSYPRYNGTGDESSASSYTCATP
jgi:feruloyl esterase